MTRTPSTMLELGTQAPDFSLPSADGRMFSLRDFDDRQALLVMFICNHCPFVKHIRDQLASIGRDYQNRNFGIVAISSNDIENYPDDAPDKMILEANEAGYTFPYLYDATQEVAKAYRAACTPDFYLFDKARRLVYRGQLDDSRPKTDIPVTGEDLRAAIEHALSGQSPDQKQVPSLGCNIKWIPGNEPDYFEM